MNRKLLLYQNNLLLKDNKASFILIFNNNTFAKVIYYYVVMLSLYSKFVLKILEGYFVKIIYKKLKIDQISYINAEPVESIAFDIDMKQEENFFEEPIWPSLARDVEENYSSSLSSENFLGNEKKTTTEGKNKSVD
jgi:hypothetical protein